MSPILVRPVREQLEHDRVIRLLPQELGARKVEVAINPGAEQNAAVGTARKEYPDAVLYSTDKTRRLMGVVEVETGESVNNLEAMAQWAHLARLKVPFHLYVPMGSVDVARRLSADHQIRVAEIWSYHHVGEQLRFTLIHRDAAIATLPRPSAASKTARPPAAIPAAAAAVPVPAAPAAAVSKPAPKASTPMPRPPVAKATRTKPLVKSRAAAIKLPAKVARGANNTAKTARAVSRPPLRTVKSKTSKAPAKAVARRPTAKPAARPAARSAKRK